MHAALKAASFITDNILDTSFLDVWTTPTHIPDFLFGRTRHRQFQTLSVAPVLQWGHAHKQEYINKIPVEILGEIFKFCVLDYQGSPVTVSSHGRRTPFDSVTPLLLGQVCALWRQIILSMPTLWSTIYVYQPRMRDLCLVPLWLERSKPCTLSIILSQSRGNFSGGFQAIQDSATKSLLSLVIPHLHRVRYLSLSLYNETEILAEDIPVDAAPILEYLKLDLFSLRFESIHRMCRGLAASPFLRSCSLDWQEKSLSFSIPWSQLIDISINVDISLHDLVKILGHCTQVKSLTIGKIDFTTPLSSLPVVLQYLEHLQVNTIDSDPVFNSLTVPSLVSIGAGGNLTKYKQWAALDRMICRSLCQLKKWEYYCWHNDESSMISNLGSPFLQMVTHVEFPFRATEQLFLALSLKDAQNRPLYLPCLQSMSTFTPEADDAVVANFIASRNSQTLFQFTFSYS